ncbi:epidermal differentiation protein starting with MTF motif and rich in histidine [Gallus gallus]|uniref:Epidermal differentiation protein n=1 Tax=Gallus gallus TaxID=9031 RepID=A0A088BHA7_CHICK|nr:epidermal differentiation protein starting with MTF motif and rich in histidine [Gallus gallus]AHA62422.1 epidermal differentiation protein [Gallus gallus]|eukprot:NP_001338370.1 epidermal differentiation protein starting with MTF motif and rich in histidine [Gallus gallus]
MTFHREFYNDEHYSPFCQEDLHGLWGLNDHRFKHLYGLHRDHHHDYNQHWSPYGYNRSFGSLYGNRSLSSHGGYYGHGDFFGFGHRHPYFSQFGHRYWY